MAAKEEGSKPKAFELVKISDDAIDLVSRAVDAKGRLCLSPALTVEVIAIARGLAMSEWATGLVQKAMAEPAWAREQLRMTVNDVASDAELRAQADQEAEEVLRKLMKPNGPSN